MLHDTFSLSENGVVMQMIVIHTFQQPTSSPIRQFFMFLSSVAFPKSFFFQKFFQNTFSVKQLVSRSASTFVVPDRGPNCFQWLYVSPS